MHVFSCTLFKVHNFFLLSLFSVHLTTKNKSLHLMNKLCVFHLFAFLTRASWDERMKINWKYTIIHSAIYTTTRFWQGGRRKCEKVGRDFRCRKGKSSFFTDDCKCFWERQSCTMRESLIKWQGILIEINSSAEKEMSGKWCFFTSTRSFPPSAH